MAPKKPTPKPAPPKPASAPDTTARRAAALEKTKAQHAHEAARQAADDALEG